MIFLAYAKLVKQPFPWSQSIHAVALRDNTKSVRSAKLVRHHARRALTRQVSV